MTKTNKPFYIVTYIIALLCLVAGFVFCLHTETESIDMLVTQLPDAFKALIGSSDVTFSGSITYALGSFNLDVGALFVLLYAVVTVVGIILLIPSFIGKKAAKGCSFTIEIIAVIVLMFVLINEAAYSRTRTICLLGLFIAMGGTGLMLAIQTIVDKKGSGLLKCVMAILGVAGVFALLDLAFLSYYPEDEIFGICALFAQANGSAVTGGDVIKNLIETGDSLFGSGAGAIASWCAGIAVLLAIINAGIDLILVGSKASRGVNLFDLIRYALECLIAVVAVICLYVVSGSEFGLLLFAVVALSFISAIISVIRFACCKKTAEEGEEASAETAAEPVADEENAVEMIPAAPDEEEGYITEDGVVRYREREPYTGPEDSFISRLTESEKKEFAKIFLDKIYGPYENIPDYVVDGDNRDFFDSVFVYLGKFRPILSDGLMRKLYSEKNLLN